MNLKGIKLNFVDKAGSGLQIEADFNKGFNFVEYASAPNSKLPVLQNSALIGYEPWVQFPPEKYNKIMTSIFKEIVKLWNEKYSN